MRDGGRTGQFYGDNHREICGRKGETPGGNKREDYGGGTSPTLGALLSLGRSKREKLSFLKTFEFPLLGDNVVRLY